MKHFKEDFNTDLKTKHWGLYASKDTSPVDCYQCEFEDTFINSLNWTFIINIDISIYNNKDVYVEVHKDTDSDLYAFQNPYDYEICFSDYH